MKRLLPMSMAVALGLTMVCPATGQDDRALIAQVAAERPQTAATSVRQDPQAAASPPPDTAPGELDRREHRARTEVTVAEMRLELVLARKALRAGDATAAARHALRVARLVRALPPGYDASAFALMAEGIVSRAEKAGVDVTTLRLQPVATPTASPRTSTAPADGAAGAPLPHPRTPSGRTTVYPQASDDPRATGGPHPAADGSVYYPADWPERIARRAAYRGGQIARSDSWIDQEGREWYVAVYDVHDLIYVPPDFRPYLSLDSSENLRTVTDRNAFWTTGGAAGFWGSNHLEQTITALDYFGGVDPYVRRGPKYSVEREQQIADMIEAFTTPRTESKIIILEP